MFIRKYQLSIERLTKSARTGILSANTMVNPYLFESE